MVIWVSGAAGKLGTAVVSALRAAGDTVIGVDLQAAEPTARIDLRDYDAVAASMVDAEAVIHLAARPSPEGIAPSALVENNTMATFNVLEAASSHGIDRVVLASSGSIYGYAWSPTMIEPAHVPVDEDSPLQFVDPYALTKDLGERMGRMFARRGMSVVALRFHWILTRTELRDRRDTVDTEEGARNLWGYVELEDAARACVLAATAGIPPGTFHPLVIAGADTMMSTTTTELLDRRFPRVERRRDFHDTEGAFDCSRAHQIIGWQPAFAW